MAVVCLVFYEAFDMIPHNIHLSKEIGIWYVDCSVDEELAGWSLTEGGGQWQNVQMEISDKCCPIVVHIGTSTL